MAIASCTPSVLLNTWKCLKCLSASEMKAVMVLALAEDLGLTVAEVLENSACFNCLSKTQLLQSATAVTADSFLSRYASVDELRTAIKCLLCAPSGKLDAALTYEICAYMNQVQ